MAKSRSSWKKLKLESSLLLKTLIVVLGVVTVIFGLNEATKDVFDSIGSNYWQAYSAVLSGTVLIAIVFALSRRSKK
jgi:heme A synthase